MPLSYPIILGMQSEYPMTPGPCPICSRGYISRQDAAFYLHGLVVHLDKESNVTTGIPTELFFGISWHGLIPPENADDYVRPEATLHIVYEAETDDFLHWGMLVQVYARHV